MLFVLILLTSALNTWAASELPLLTDDANDPIYYRIKNTRRTSKGTANYWTPTSLTTNQAEATQVYFTGTKNGSVLCVKIHQKDTQATLLANYTWGEGIDWYIKQFSSAQGGTDATTGSTYKGVIISNASTFPNVTGDKMADDGLGCWYVGSSNTAAWLYGGQWDGSIFTMEIVDPSRLPEEEPDNGLIKNASFETGDLTGWVYGAIGGDHGVKDNGNSTYTVTNAQGDWIYNTWKSSDNYVDDSQTQCVYQTIPNVPVGEYKLVAQVASNTYSNVKTPVTLFANDFTVDDLPLHKGEFIDFELDGIMVTPDVRSLTVGVRSASWFKCDNFQLIPLGETKAYKDYLEKQYADASIANPVLFDAFDGQQTNAFTYKEIGGHTHGGYPLSTGGVQNDYTMVDRSKMQVWTGGSYQLGNSTTSVSYTGLPNGYYRISSEVRVYDNNGDYDGTAAGLSIYANSESCPITTGTGITHGNMSGKGFYGDYNVICEVKDGTLEAGFRLDGSSFNWLGWQNFRVEFIGTQDPGNGLLDLNLTKDEYAALCLPYDLKPTYFGQTFIVADIAGKEATLIAVDEVPAGTPCVVKATGENNVSASEVDFNFNSPVATPTLWNNVILQGDFDTYSWTALPVKGNAIEASTLTYKEADLSNLTFTASQENNAAARFWAQNATYSTSSASVIEKYLGEPTYKRRDQPNPILVPVIKNEEAQTLFYSTKETMEGAKQATVAAGQTTVEIFNLMPGLTYYYNTSDGKSKGQFTVGGTLRMIYVGDHVYNMRDLGGKRTSSGKYVKYGKIFRSGEMNGGYVATAAELQTMRDMGVAAEIDLRNEETGTGISPFGFTEEEGTYYAVRGKNYIADGPGSIDKEDAHMHWKNEFMLILNNLRDLRGIDFHCRIGADRTGMLAILLEGLLGVKEADLLRDYETTSFSTAAGTRIKSNNGFDNLLNNTFKPLIPASGTLRDAFDSFFVNTLGVAKKDIVEFRNLMLDSDPTADAAIIEQLSSLESLKAAINKGNRYQVGDKLGQYASDDEEAVEAFRSATAKAEAYIAAKDFDNETIVALTREVDEAATAMVSGLVLNMPAEGDAMYLKSNSYGGYISCTGVPAEDGNIYFTMIGEPDGTCLFTYDGSYLTNYMSGLTFATSRNASNQQPAASVDQAGPVTISASASGTIGCYNIKTPGNILLTKANGTLLECYSNLTHTDADIQLIPTKLPDESAEQIEIRNALNKLKNALQTLDSYSIGEGLSQYTSSLDNDYCLDVIAEAQEYMNAETHTLGAIKDHLASVNDIQPTLTLNMPEAGQYMTIQSVAHKAYVSCDGTQFPMVATANDKCVFYYDGNQFINHATGLVFNRKPNNYGQGVDARIMAVEKSQGATITIKTSCMNTIGAYSLHTKDGSDSVMLLTKEAGSNLDGFYTWFGHDDEDVYLHLVDDPTGIQTIPTAQRQHAGTFDLSGRKVSRLVKGIYLQDGRKIVK